MGYYELNELVKIPDVWSPTCGITIVEYIHFALKKGLRGQFDAKLHYDQSRRGCSLIKEFGVCDVCPMIKSLQPYWYQETKYQPKK
jgi:hypothetical protein